MDCVIDSAKVFVNDNIDRDTLVSFTANYLDGEDPAWGAVYEKAIDICIARIKEYKIDDIKLKSNSFGKCNPKAMMMMHCVKQKVFQNCPAKFWTSSKKLNIQFCR